tara:strand:- start:101 stop:1147 length:1047 start_codon:yes stop_codon:yes gene_type:complete
MPGDKSPTRPEGGWKLHEKQLQDIYDWVKRERFLPGPGIIETPNGKRLMPRDYDRLPQFHPTLFYGDDTTSVASSGIATESEASTERQAGFADNGISTLTRLAIRLGYVFGPFKGGGTGGVCPNAACVGYAAGQQIANIQQWVFEPKIGSTLLSAARPPTLQLNKGGANYIYLQVNWLSHSVAVGGFTYDTASRGFKAHHKLSADGPTDGPTGEAAPSAHTHTIPTLEVADGNSNGVGPQEEGVIVPIDRRYYYIDTANPPVFVNLTDENPPIETETKTYIAAGYITLNQNGLIEGNGDINGFRWFLEGPVWARREAIYVTGYSSPDHSEPTAIVAAEGMEMPGSGLL